MAINAPTEASPLEEPSIEVQLDDRANVPDPRQFAQITLQHDQPAETLAEVSTRLRVNAWSRHVFSRRRGGWRHPLDLSLQAVLRLRPMRAPR